VNDFVLGALFFFGLSTFFGGVTHWVALMIRVGPTTTPFVNWWLRNAVVWPLLFLSLYLLRVYGVVA
jgi:hypothetical protein